jgi:hypothetical protein
MIRRVGRKAWYGKVGIRWGREPMRQILGEQFLNAKGFPPAIWANMTVREVMTLAFVNQMHCIRLAYLHKSQKLYFASDA